MSQMQKMMNEFEGTNVTTITYKGRPCWLVKEVGAVLGYAEKGLSQRITREWSDEFNDGDDLVVLTGKDVLDFSNAYNGLQVAVAKNTTTKLSPKTRNLLLLTEPGLYLVLAKTNKPVGKRFRKFITREVMPQIARDGHYMPGRTVDARGRLSETVEQRKLRELSVREKELCLEAARMLADTLGDKLGTEALTTLNISAAEIIMGRDFSALKPRVDDGWMTPTQIGKRFKVSAHMVGRAISALDLRGAIPGMSMPFLDQGKYSRKQVVAYRYSPEAVRRIGARVRPDPGRGVLKDATVNVVSSPTGTSTVPPGWKTPQSIARDLGRPLVWVGRAITCLKLRGNTPGVCMQAPFVHKSGHRPYIYSPLSAEKIKGWFERRDKRSLDRARGKNGVRVSG